MEPTRNSVSQFQSWTARFPLQFIPLLLSLGGVALSSLLQTCEFCTDASLSLQAGFILSSALVSFIGVVYCAEKSSLQTAVQVWALEVWNLLEMYLTYSSCREHRVLFSGCTAIISFWYYSQVLGYSRNTVFALLWKQLVCWSGIEAIADHKIWESLCVIICLIVTGVLYLIATQTSSEEKSEPSSEYWGLKQLFDCLLCGIVILEKNEIRLFNTTMSKLLNTSKPIEMLELLLKVPTLQFKIRRLEKLRDSWTSFGTMRCEEQRLEWFGCKLTLPSGSAVALICRSAAVQETDDKEKCASPELIRSVSHNLKTPMNCIMHMSEELISASEMSMKGGRNCKVISTCCQLMSYLINDIVDYSQFNSKAGIVLRKGQVNLAEVLHNCVQMVSFFAESKKLTIDCSLDPSLPVYIFTDQTRLIQVVLNLLSNAIKYTFQGTIKVIALQASARRVKIMIEDSGIGISQVHFESLFSGSSSLKSISTGGIGLTLSNKIAQELGFSEIQISSEQGVGSCFTFYVCISDYPVCEATPGLRNTSPLLDVGEIDRHQCAPIFNTSESRRNMADKCADILLVDDYPFNRMVVRTFLSKEGLTIQEADNGQNAIHLVKDLHRQQQHFRLILMDIDMPVLDGIQATERLLAMKISDPEFVLPPIIGHSAFTSDEDIKKYMEVGMQGFIPKPFTRDQAMDLIWKVIMPPGQ